jgi:hypothetical protein
MGGAHVISNYSLHHRLPDFHLEIPATDFLDLESRLFFEIGLNDIIKILVVFIVTLQSLKKSLVDTSFHIHDLSLKSVSKRIFFAPLFVNSNNDHDLDFVSHSPQKSAIPDLPSKVANEKSIQKPKSLNG